MQAIVASSAGPRWTALRVVAGMLKSLAWLITLLGVAGSIGSFLLLAGFLKFDGIVFPIGNGFVLALVYLIGGLVGTLLMFLFFYATSELVLLLIAIENNTRQRRY